MRIKHRYAFRTDDNYKILKFIEERKIKYQPPTSEIPIAAIYIFEDDQNWIELKKIVDEYNLHPITSCEYSKAEYKQASWFKIRTPNHKLYPQPEDEYIERTYDSSCYCSKCGSNKKRLSEFRINGAIKWGKKNFLTLNWVHDQLFINDEVYNELIKSDFVGFDFMDVRNFKSDNIISGIKQIIVINKIPYGLVEDMMSFKKIYT